MSKEHLIAAGWDAVHINQLADSEAAWLWDQHQQRSVALNCVVDGLMDERGDSFAGPDEVCSEAYRLVDLDPEQLDVSDELFAALTAYHEIDSAIGIALTMKDMTGSCFPGTLH